ncbi:pyruvate dehydrogenase protein X component, mitochondrial-like [Physella acuta]|uniref:pyruvate dehydrogenase protein X component, mitochondrial-like n=1 Tax=Physella acuta TaxID=109671 RepID=UPI0027DAD2DA|nr:pyruvate dehydrogenase protein X component, mitochondrial-like [Physella acuta]
MATSVTKIYCRLTTNKISLFPQLNNFRIKNKASQCMLRSHFHDGPALYATIKLDMPSLSPTMEKGNIVKWHKKEGDTISPGDVLCEVETDKAIVAMDTELEGVLAKILVPDKTADVPVGSLIALMVEEGDDWKKVEIPAGAGLKSPASPSQSASVSAPASSGAKPAEHGHLVGPSVKKLLQEYNISSASVKPSGPSGALLKGDVLNYIESKNLNKVPQVAPAVPVVEQSPAAQPTTPQTLTSAGNYVDIPLSNMRRTIARRLTESKSTIPHAYASIDSDLGALTTLRADLAASGMKVSVNDFIIKAAALTLQRNPRINAIWANDGPQLSSSVDISVAVATPNGLITPVVKGANYLAVNDIGSIVKELSGRAREGKLQPHEYQGGSFSISNLGMFGITEFTAVINPPQLAILAVGTSRKQATMNGNVLKMTVTMSYDSRAVNEAEATLFLEEFRYILEHPKTMIMGSKLDPAKEAFAF